MEDWHIDPDEDILTRRYIERLLGTNHARGFLKGRGSISVADMLHKEPVPKGLVSIVFFEARDWRPFVTHDLLIKYGPTGMYAIHQGLIQRIVWASYGLDGPFRACSFSYESPQHRAYKEGSWQDLEHDQAPKLRDFLIAKKEA